MTEVLHSSCSSSPSPSSISTPSSHGTLFQTHQPLKRDQEEKEGKKGLVSEVVIVNGEVKRRSNKDRNSNQLSLIALFVTLFRKSFLMACKTGSDGELCSSSSNSSDGADGGAGSGGLEIGWPTDVQHVAHVTFDRFNGFRGLPVEFEPEVLRRAPSASATVFGVSTESMQLSFDSRGNSVPTILLQMQNRLYAQGGLQIEGIFRITAGNSQEEYVRDQLNRGVVPEDIDVHCLAGLIKAWFRELPRGILDPLSPEEVMQCQSQEHCVALVRLLPPTEAALLDWAVNLMADVVLLEHLNKMNARNIAMVFAPNMTQMVDPLTALMYAVQVMNFLKTLIERTLQEREDSVIETPRIFHLEPTNEDENQSPPQICRENAAESNVVETEHDFVVEERYSDIAVDDLDLDTTVDENQVENISDEEYISFLTTTEESDGSGGSCETPNRVYIFSNLTEASAANDLKTPQTSKTGQSSEYNQARSAAKIDAQKVVGQDVIVNDNKRKALSKLSRINSITERIEAWR